MDEEESADVLFNKNASRGKGKRTAASLLSDEDHSGEDTEGSQGEASDSVEDDDDDSLDEEDEDGEEEDMEDGCEDEEREIEGVVGNGSADFAGLSSDEDAEKCPICLNPFCDQPVATPENCAHYFCVDCIHEWAKKVNSCPVDRIVFNNILLRKCFGGEVKKTIPIKKPVELQQEQEVDALLEDTHCEACGGSDREDRMLLCDGCDAGYHMECLTPPLDAVPVEEWFCPQCAPFNSHTTSERSEDESIVLPTTSRPQPRLSRTGRAIARTQHSERVRASVNRHRIMQARTAAQVAPQNLIQPTWLDETINAVLARINTGRFQRDFIPRPQPRRRRRTVRRKSKKQGKAAGSRTSTKKVKTRKRRARRTKSRRKVVAKKETTSRGRIAQNLGFKNPTRGSSIPSVYRPYEQTLSSMRAEIGAASLSIYGDSAIFSSSDDERTEQTPGLSSLLEAKYRGLSHSALRSHQPVARPITAGMSRQGHSISHVEEVTEAAPVPDLLGSILSGQTLLLMDSSDVIINRDGSLKPTKPVCLPSSRSSISARSASEIATSTGTELIQSSREIAPFSRPLTSSSNSSVQPCCDTLIPAPVCPPASRAMPSINGHLSPRVLQKQVASQSPGNGHSQQGSSGIRDQHPARITNGTLESHTGGRGNALPQAPAKKPPIKPVWVDVSALPKIPKIKKESNSLEYNSTESNRRNLPDSSMTSLAGDNGRQHSVDQQGTSTSRPERTVDNQRQRVDKAGPSSSFSNSFSSSPLSTSVASNPQPSSSSTISFRISGSRNPWHARRLSAPEPSLSVKNAESEKKNKKTRQMLLLSHSQAKPTTVKSEVYDPFDPTGSDSSDEEEKGNPKMNIHSTGSSLPTVGTNEGSELQIKREPKESSSPVKEEGHGMCEEVKNKPTSPKNNLWSLPFQQLITRQTPIQSESPNTECIPGLNPVMSDAECSGTPGSPLIKNVVRSRSSSSSSHHSDMVVKMELKTEPDLRSSLVESKSLAQVPKGNGFISESSSVAGSSDASDKSKEREIRSLCMQPVTSSQNPPSKSSGHSHKKKKHSQTEDRRRSRSRSPVHLQSHSRHNEPRHSQDREHSREKGRSRDMGRMRETEHSRTRGRSPERTHSSSQRHSTRSTSRESSRERTHTHERHKLYNNREREQLKLCKKKKKNSSNSKSRSRSRSGERRREQPSSHGYSSESKDEEISKSKRKRSTSRDRRHRADVRHKKRNPEKTPFNLSTSVEAMLVDLSPVTCSAMDTEHKTESELTVLPVEPMEESTEAEPLHAPCAVKQEPADPIDEDASVEYLIDNLDFIKKEIKIEAGADQAETVEPKPSMSVEATGAKQDSVSALAGTKAPSQGKRVTWNIQEPEVPQAERISKLALFKMKLKQEGSRKAASFPFTQTASKEASAAQEPSNPVSTSLSPAELEGALNLAHGKSKSLKEECSDPQQKDTYFKKLHMQERAIEEVKLAIKPYYQKRDITKDEYKEILRKAVQKVCHSKSGEINPLKVANLVKAYVDKYKYARKHYKEEESGQKESAENPKDLQSA